MRVADVDECIGNQAGCAGQATCTNTDGSFLCECNVGFQGDGFTCTGMPYQHYCCMAVSMTLDARAHSHFPIANGPEALE